MLSSHPLPAEALAGQALRRNSDAPPPSKSGPRASQRRALTDRFSVDSYLESGGTADVFVATELETGCKVALKVLREHAANSAILRAHFLVGARAAMRIEHPNVVRVLGVYEPMSGSPYAAMELLEGKPLDALIAGERPVAPELAVELMRQAARGLAAAHTAGVVHCDVKPENLFVTLGKGSPLVKSLDFDLAAVDGHEEAGEDHVLRGTAKYMAPEQIVGDPVDGRTDVYGLGIVLFRLLTGQLPFDVPLGAALLCHQLYSPVPPVSWLTDGLGADLPRVVGRATRKNPDHRYPSMRALLADLERLSAGEPVGEDATAQLPDEYTPRTARGRANASALASMR